MMVEALLVLSDSDRDVAIRRDRLYGVATMEPMRFEFEVEGMTCGHCQRAVEQCIAALPGTQSVHVDLRAGTAIVVGDLPCQDILHAIENEGYQARETHREPAVSEPS